MPGLKYVCHLLVWSRYCSSWPVNLTCGHSQLHYNTHMVSMFSTHLIQDGPWSSSCLASLGPHAEEGGRLHESPHWQKRSSWVSGCEALWLRRAVSLEVNIGSSVVPKLLTVTYPLTHSGRKRLPLPPLTAGYNNKVFCKITKYEHIWHMCSGSWVLFCWWVEHKVFSMISSCWGKQRIHSQIYFDSSTPGQ